MAIQRLQDLTAQEKAAVYEMRLLTRAVPSFAYYHCAQMAEQQTVVPDREGVTINWRRFAALPAATTPLSEGQSPTATIPSVVPITARVEEYGAWMAFTQRLQKTGVDNNVLAFSELLGEQVGLTMDTLVRDVVTATTNIVRPGTHTARGTITSGAADRMSASLLLRALRTLNSANARPFDNGRYLAVISPATEVDMMLDTTIQNIMMQALPRDTAHPLINGYIGTIFGVDFFRSSNARVFVGAGSGGVDVHATMIFGRDGFGIGGLAAEMPGRLLADHRDSNTGRNIKLVDLILTPPEAPSKEDPLRQRGTIGWRTTFAVQRLNESFLVMAEHGVSP